jgi:hypothetical protein
VVGSMIAKGIERSVASCEQAIRRFIDGLVIGNNSGDASQECASA